MRMRRPTAVVDVSQLPDVVFGPRDIMWWGSFGFIVIEGWALVLCAVVYVYLHQNFQEWPPSGTPLPSLGIPTLSVALMLASLPFVRWCDRIVHNFDRARARVALLALGVLGFVLAGLRVAELLVSLNVKWDTNAYGSAQWLVLGYHFTLVLVEACEVTGIALAMWFAPIEDKHFPDASDAMMYWYFMVLSWIPLYVLCFLWPRWI
jgi:cytochrome c oxidase subunit III